MDQRLPRRGAPERRDEAPPGRPSGALEAHARRCRAAAVQAGNPVEAAAVLAGLAVCLLVYTAGLPRVLQTMLTTTQVRPRALRFTCAGIARGEGQPLRARRGARKDAQLHG